MEEVIIAIAKQSPVVGILMFMVIRIFKLYTDEKKARIRSDERFLDYLKEEGKDKSEIIQKDTDMKGKLLMMLDRQAKKKE